MAQEAVLLLREVEEACAQPLELPAEPFQVARPLHDDRPREGPAPELADGLVDLADRAREQRDEHQHDERSDRGQRRRLPVELALGLGGDLLHGGELRVEVGAGLLPEHLDRIAHRLEHFDGMRDCRRPRWVLVQRLGELGCIGANELNDPSVGGIGFQLLKGREACVETRAVLGKGVTVLAHAERLIEAGRALHQRDELEELLRLVRDVDAVVREALAAHRELLHLEGGVDHGDQQRDRDQRETDQEEAAQGFGSRDAHPTDDISVNREFRTVLPAGAHAGTPRARVA